MFKPKKKQGLRSKRRTRHAKTGPMNSRNILGLVICVLLFLLGIVIPGNVGMYFNISGLLVVLGGTLGAALICFRLERLAIVCMVIRSSYLTRVKEPDEVIEILLDLSVKSKLKGILSLQEDEESASILFLRRALGFLVDGYPALQIRDLLYTEMHFFRMRREESERVLRQLAEFAPSFGLMGSVVGLVSMLAGVGDTAVILATVPISLTATLYGVVLANFVFAPLATQIRERTDQELLLQRFITEAVNAIASELHPRLLERKLKSFLTPSSRKGQLVSYRRIQEKFNIKPDPESKKRPVPETDEGVPLPVDTPAQEGFQARA